MMDEKKAKPDIEWFGKFMFKGFCGCCGRIMWAGAVVEDSTNLRKLVTECPHCLTAVEWEGIK